MRFAGSAAQLGRIDLRLFSNWPVMSSGPVPALPNFKEAHTEFVDDGSSHYVAFILTDGDKYAHVGCNTYRISRVLPASLGHRATARAARRGTTTRTAVRRTRERPSLRSHPFSRRDSVHLGPSDVYDGADRPYAASQCASRAAADVPPQPTFCPSGKTPQRRTTRSSTTAMHTVRAPRRRCWSD